ncbi:signal peptide-containing protein [Theileria equi strain WA]|uniref:Signal peptide-containing protein n=1 Tax=Theileria equi strain WA TaxID=1537102 RepID=L0AWQ3_THEEQ|nr:signal peptide-containing protein [Theileria equi strain WA]AFZ80022.1 signal peptide-containing protein [Theileria equi strain WA]|eukprot:XP_004829688.1 signal peptide-containing protein [Theileria equi strain WA]
MKIFVLVPVFLISLAVGVLADGPDGSSSVKSPREELTDLQGKLKSDSLHAMENHTKRNEIKEKLQRMIKMIEYVSKDTGRSFGDAMKQVTDMEQEISKHVKKILIKMRPVYHDSNTLILEIDRVLAGTDEDAVTAKIQEAKELLERNKPVLEELEKDYRGKYAQFEALETALRNKGLVILGKEPDPYGIFDDTVGESGYSGSDIRDMFLGKTPIPALTKKLVLEFSLTLRASVFRNYTRVLMIKNQANEYISKGNELSDRFTKLVPDIGKFQTPTKIKEMEDLLYKIKDDISLIMRIFFDFTKLIGILGKLDEYYIIIQEFESSLSEYDDNAVISEDIRIKAVESCKDLVKYLEDIKESYPTWYGNLDKLKSAIKSTEDNLNAANSLCDDSSTSGAMCYGSKGIVIIIGLLLTYSLL